MIFVKFILFFIYLSRFVVLGVVPFTSISYLNYKIYVVVSKRRRNGRRAHEDNLSIILMTIVGSFLVCNTLRIFLNMHEITVIKEIYICRWLDNNQYWLLTVMFWNLNKDQFSNSNVKSHNIWILWNRVENTDIDSLIWHHQCFTWAKNLNSSG